VRAGFRYSYDYNNDGVWDFGDGQTYAGSVLSNSGRVPARYLADNGSYPVRARVFDQDSGFTEYTTQVIVTNLAPTARLNIVGTPVANQPATFNFSWQFDESAADRAAGYTYKYDFNSDGVFETSTRATKQTYTFAQAGNYMVRAKIVDKDGGESMYSLEFVVAAPIPIDLGSVLNQ
jgi:PKD repeat protein